MKKGLLTFLALSLSIASTASASDVFVRSDVSTNVIGEICLAREDSLVVRSCLDDNLTKKFTQTSLEFCSAATTMDPDLVNRCLAAVADQNVDARINDCVVAGSLEAKQIVQCVEGSLDPADLVKLRD